MKHNYSIKLNFLRVMYVLLVLAGCILYNYDLADYILLIAIVLVFGGLFTISTADLTAREIKIRKSYFWGLFTTRKNLTYDQIISIRAKDYTIEMDENADTFTDSVFSFLMLTFFKSKIAWLTTKLSYEHNGKSSAIEVELTKEDYKSIEKSIVLKDDYGRLGSKGRRKAQQQ